MPEIQYYNSEKTLYWNLPFAIPNDNNWLHCGVHKYYQEHLHGLVAHHTMSPGYVHIVINGCSTSSSIKQGKWASLVSVYKKYHACTFPGCIKKHLNENHINWIWCMVFLIFWTNSQWFEDHHNKFILSTLITLLHGHRNCKVVVGHSNNHDSTHPWQPISATTVQIIAILNWG